MALSLNEIRKRAVAFAKEFADDASESAESQTFWNYFFNIFGISRKRVASFEKPVEKLGNKKGRIDLLWKGILLVEHKSKGESLDKAYNQALDYFPGLKEEELPKYVLVSDFSRFRLFDLEEDTQVEFKLKELHKNIDFFGFISGYNKKTYEDEAPVNIQAAELMGALHDKLYEAGYSGHKLEVFLVRILFCLFADDTGIFEKNAFTEYIDLKTKEDGSDLGNHLAHIFQVLNTPRNKRQNTLDESLNQFVYVNGKLFEEILDITAFDSDMRKELLRCCYFDWSRISPAIFGSLFQSVMDPEQRRDIGAHYTSEKNILKLIKALFLDDLYSEFEKVKSNTKELKKFHKEIASLRFLDPACGCGNFLVITYRELRLLELKVIKVLYKNLYEVINIGFLLKIDVDSMFGFEVKEFPARIAEVAMWLVDHQMNLIISEEYGDFYVRLPLKKTATIINENALRLDWEKIIDENKISYILGNPPFVGKQLRNSEQSDDMALIFKNVKGYGVLDYVAAWYIKAAQCIQNKRIKVAFVSTNSISQGEQVGILWNELFNKYKIRIHFAHRTFKWLNMARGNAQVHVVIIGFANFKAKERLISYYDNPNSDPYEIKVSNINPYLVEGDDFVILKSRDLLCEVPNISFGSMPNDGGHLLLTNDEMHELISKEPGAKKFIRPLLSAKEYINNIKRWCLWLVNITPKELRSLPEVAKRVKKVQAHRLNSKRLTTNRLSHYPTLFGENRQPESDYLLIPRVTSKSRKYIPMNFCNNNNIINDSCLFIQNASFYHFGVLSSKMHMTWVNYICGRLKSDFRYSNELVYNNYPWPENASKKNIMKVEEMTERVLDIRLEYPDCSLADLYDPYAMPPKLVKAHHDLDRAVDLCYRSNPFVHDTNRIEYLFELYEKYKSPLLLKKNKK